MEALYDAFVGLDSLLQIAILGAAVKLLTSGVQKVPIIKDTIDGLLSKLASDDERQVAYAKAAKQFAVVLLATAAALSEHYFFGGESSLILARILTMTMAAVTLHEGWQKQALAWLKSRPKK